MAMSSETANKYFQGKENVAMAIARRRIKAGGDVKAALALIPITKPVYARYRDVVSSANTRTSSSDRGPQRALTAAGSRSRPWCTDKERPGSEGPEAPARRRLLLTNAAGRGSGPHCPPSGGATPVPPLYSPRGSIGSMSDLSLTEVARQLEVSPGTLRRWARDGHRAAARRALDARGRRPRPDRRAPARARAHARRDRGARRLRAAGLRLHGGPVPAAERRRHARARPPRRPASSRR